jgi:hypothetical protein
MIIARSDSKSRGGVGIPTSSIGIFPVSIARYNRWNKYSINRRTGLSVDARAGPQPTGLSPT